MIYWELFDTPRHMLEQSWDMCFEAMAASCRRRRLRRPKIGCYVIGKIACSYDFPVIEQIIAVYIIKMTFIWIILVPR